MKKQTYVPLVILLAIVCVFALWWYYGTSPASQGATTAAAASYKNVTYSIDNQPITLVNGHARSEIVAGSASQELTDYFGNEATGDLNGDGSADVAFLLTQQGGGSGTFYYIVAALKTPNGYEGTNGILLGDRIAPQTTQIENGEIVVNYADRKPTDPMTTPPSVGVTRYFKVENGTLVEVPNQ